MRDGSDTPQNDNEGFIGFRCNPDLKAEAKAEAQRRGISLSELARRRLKELTTGNRPKPAA